MKGGSERGGAGPSLPWGERGPRRLGTAGFCAERLPESLRGAGCEPSEFPLGCCGLELVPCSR